MIPLTSEETKKLIRNLSKYKPRTTIARAAGLLTIPCLQANTLRLELLVHLAVMHCAGSSRPDHADFSRWLNKYLGKTRIASYEDPVEDAFITNVITPYGNRRIFEGIWDSNDYFLQVTLEALQHRKTPPMCRDFLAPAYALLVLSDLVAERLNLQRWYSEPTSDKGIIKLSKASNISGRAQAVIFSNENLKSIGISKKELFPFIFREEDLGRLTSESIGHTSLERRPIVDFGDAIILTLPHAVSPAIRRFIISELRKLGYLKAFSNIISRIQGQSMEKEGLFELKSNTTSLVPPEPDDLPIPSAHAWLLKYDTNKFLHVILLHDQINGIYDEGLASFMKYNSPLVSNLEKYIHKIASYCKALPDFVEGTTLIVMGGLGRGFALGFKDWPADWGFSVIGIQNLLMLAKEPRNPIKLYLKCMKQKAWAEKEGVKFQTLSGDFNFYCFWRDMKYQLVPRDYPINQGTMILAYNDFICAFRKEIRALVDSHAIETADGRYSHVERFGQDYYFKSMQERPIYASLGHLRFGILAGAVESSRGASWLFIEPKDDTEPVRDLLYEIWSGFLGLFDKLVNEIEQLPLNYSSLPLEVRLDFSKIVVPDDASPIGIKAPIPDPEVTIEKDERKAVAAFPADFLAHFQQPENLGEKIVVKALTQCLVGIHKESDQEIEEPQINKVIEAVVGTEGTRVLHIFHTHYPIEFILSRPDSNLTHISQADFVFAKLRLSEGCTSYAPETDITNKEDCNKFLHRTVIKVWESLRELLKKFNRASVISKTLQVHETVIHDRDHWKRTAQAVIALYSNQENVYAIAQKREKERNLTALPARTILEMSICECPVSGGRELSEWDLDELLAKAALLIEVATDSDAVNSDLVAPHIHLHANGEYTLDRNFHKTVIDPFFSNYMKEEFDDAAADYSQFYNKKPVQKRRKIESIFSAEFIDAFTEEFGMTPDEAVDGFAGLIEIAVEQDSKVVTTTLGKLKSRLLNQRGLSETACNAFINTFSIFHRPSWDKPPKGFKNKDLNPWRYRRRLSATARPLLVFGHNEDDQIFYGAGSLKLGLGYLLDRPEQGQLPGDFFSSNKMKKYIGSVNDKRGHAFARSIADRLRKSGWEVRNEVKMSELKTDPILADGDIDVLAWKSNGEVLIIECKRLQLARTIAEIAEICRRFQGEAKDELGKHLRRVNWVKNNPESLKLIIGFVPEVDSIDDRLITNTHVPMRYLTYLPIPPEKIGPFNFLVT